MPFVYVFLLAIAGYAAWQAWLEIAPASAGLTYAALACFLGVVARVLQAEVHHRHVVDGEAQSTDGAS